MATSGSNTTSIGSSLHLRLEWQTLSQEISNNRSRVRLTLKLIQDGTGIWFSANKTGVLHGESFTYTGGFSGTGTRTLRTRDVWVNHNSDGSKSQSFSATFNIAITYSGSYRSSMSVSTTASLNSIPRASTLTAFSFPNSLQGGTGTQINYTVDRKHSNFRHRVQLLDGSTIIQTWDNQDSNGSSNVQLSASSVNTLLGRMTTVTSKSLTLVIDTRSSSGGSFIGSASSRNATASIHSNVRPTITATSVSEAVSGLNAQFGDYVQNKSKLSLSMTASGTYGSTIRSYSIKANGTTYTSRTAATVELKNSGSQSVTFEATDSRGRKTPITTVNISVIAYSEPQITKINAVRSNADGTFNEEGEFAKVNVAASISPVDNKNTKSFKVRSRPVGASTWTEQTLTVPGYSVDTDAILPNISPDLSYEIEAVVGDWFTNISAKSMPDISTAFTLMNFSPDGKGEGFGGVYEDAMGGLAQFKGDIFISNEGNFSIDAKDNTFITMKPGGDVAIAVGSSTRDDTTGAPFQVFHDGTIRTRNKINVSGELQLHGIEVVSGGSNTNGYFYKYSNGQMICQKRLLVGGASTAWGSMFYAYLDPITWTFPTAFLESPSLSMGSDANSLLIGTDALDEIAARGIHVLRPSGITYSGYVTVTATGRWK